MRDFDCGSFRAPTNLIPGSSCPRGLRSICQEGAADARVRAHGALGRAVSADFSRVCR